MRNNRSAPLAVIWRLTICAVLMPTAGSRLLAAGDASDAADDEGFISLFDGKTLDGWEIMNGGKFVAEDGVIKLNRGRGWLRTDAEYSDFILKLELRFMKPNQDSGIFLRASKEGKNWPSRRYEVQAHNDKSMARIFGAKFSLKSELAAKILKPPTQWNSYEIRCVGDKLEVRLNGELVTTAEGLKNLRGHVGLQGEGGELQFRHLRIKPLSDS